ncbi:MAG: DUF3302 domain-containing protein [Pseudomonadales bacterium]|nr:DUF3302 domain-containing protein [Pseudomonadales bacterium]
MLDYLALGTLIFAFITLFYGVIVVHDIPYEIAVHRNHPHQDAIHVAGWISLFTLGAIWPFLWIWATLYREDRGWGFKNSANAADSSLQQSKLVALEKRIEHLEQLNQIDISEQTSVDDMNKENK